jgi:multiple sugar transport system permease protein
VTSSVANSIVFLFLFNASGVVNAALAWFGINGPNWFADPRGVLHLFLGLFGVDLGSPPAWLTDHDFLVISWWQWWSGPSIAMCAIIALAIWTTSGTFMPMFLAALQDIPEDVEEAAMMDGTTTWQRFRAVTQPALKPTLFLVLTLG